MDLSRQVRYHCMRSNVNSENNEWFFLIVNDKKEIRDISDRIYNLLKPIEEEALALEGRVDNDLELYYKLIRFESEKSVEKYKVKEVYQGRVLLDRKLYDGKNPDRLANYIESLND